MPSRTAIRLSQENKYLKSLFTSAFLISLYLAYHMTTYLAQGYGGIGMDFGIFHLVGDLIWKGKLLDAYSVQKLTTLEAHASGYSGAFSPWSYPPQFNFVPALVAALPMIPSYLVFTLVTYAGYLLVLRKLAGPYFPLVFVFIFPTILIEINCGQNGFLTGALTGLFAMWVLKKTPAAGIPLGLMAIKPHLGLGLVLFALFKRRWHVLAIATVTTLLSFALATLAFGAEIWPAFLAGARDASENVASGLYPMKRMTSIFAALTSYGASMQVALSAQALSVLLAIATIVKSHVRKQAPEVTLGLALVATLAVSPYNYDYDLPIFGIGFALLLPFLATRLRKLELLSLGMFYWIAAGSGFSTTIGYANIRTALSLVGKGHETPTIAGAAYLVVLLMLARILGRKEPIS